MGFSKCLEKEDSLSSHPRVPAHANSMPRTSVTRHHKMEDSSAPSLWSLPRKSLTLGLGVACIVTWLSYLTVRDIASPVLVAADQRPHLYLQETPHALDFFASSENKAAANADDILFGMGIGDVTGPIVQTNQMGYASLPQINTGLHLREFARAYIFTTRSAAKSKRRSRRSISLRALLKLRPRLLGGIDDLRGALDGIVKGGEPDLEQDPLDGSPNRVVYINADICMGDTIVRRYLLDKLRTAYGDMYGELNVALAGTHSHAGVAGYHNNLLPTVTSAGIVDETVDAIVNGAFQAVQRAHDDLNRRMTSSDPPTVSWSNASLKDAHINRSQFAYDLNPQEERDYWASSQDDEMSQMTFRDGDAVKGFLNFYSVHGTSLYENNTLTSSDNKGLAALLYEESVEPDSLPGSSSFVAGFSQASVGDTSPRTLGAKCEFTGADCDEHHSTCEKFNGKLQLCLGRGPGWGDQAALAKSPTGSWDILGNELIARKQVDTARALVQSSAGSANALHGPVRAIKLNVPMGNFTFNNGSHDLTTCPAALGYGFAGGTTDGPGPSLFRQGTNDTDKGGKNPLIGIVKNLYRKPSKAQKACHAPKEILLDISHQNTPYSWAPGGPTGVIETQILRVGDFFILAVPTEMTTMSGRRLKAAVRQELMSQGVSTNPRVVIGSISNTYTHYTATREEYQVQRYEGSSTIFGPNQLDAYIYIYSKLLVPGLREDEAGDAVRKEFQGKGKLAKNTLPGALRLQKPVVYDTAPLFKKFGQVSRQPEKQYHSSTGNVTLTYVSSNPRNNLRLGSSYFDIQYSADKSSWKTVRTDASPWTTLRWTQTNVVTGTSEIEASWDLSKEEDGRIKPGSYRFVLRGDAKKPVTGKIEPWEGTSDVFEIVQ